MTGDVDYAYLLAVLQRPQWRTIVISKGTLQSMLHVNCDMKMRWETDILQYRSVVGGASPHVPVKPESSLSVPISSRNASSASDAPEDTADGSQGIEDSQGREDSPKPTIPLQKETMMSFRDKVLSSGEAEDEEKPDNKESDNFELKPLTEEEEWVDTVEFLRTILKENGTKSDGLYYSMLKSQVGGMLRLQNPVRFQDRDAIRSFFAQVIDSGYVIETGKSWTHNFTSTKVKQVLTNLLPVDQ